MVKSLPPQPKLRIDSEIINLLSQAETSLNNLTGLLSLFNNDHFIIKLLLIREASKSLLIDNYNYSLTEYYTKKCFEEKEPQNEIEKYLTASSLGLRLIKNVSRSAHIIKSIYSSLSGLEDSIQQKGSLYRSGLIEDNSLDKKLIFPDAEEIPHLMEHFEKYIESDVSYPHLINTALIHAQFEMIHPLEKFNGIIGRILIQLYLAWKKRNVSNCLQISDTLHTKKQEYFELLSGISNNGNWDGWIKFFLSIIISSSNTTASIIKNLFEVEQNGYNKIIHSGFATSPLLQLYKYTLHQPIVTIPQITKAVSLTKQTANIVAAKLLDLSLIEETTGKQRYRVYVNKKILNIISL
ncbi:MAG: Fic family protein [Bacteroidota bacterium]|jgi:Fic family protein